MKQAQSSGLEGVKQIWIVEGLRRFACQVPTNGDHLEVAQRPLRQWLEMLQIHPNDVAILKGELLYLYARERFLGQRLTL